MKTLLKTLAILTLVCIPFIQARADIKQAVGTWTWSFDSNGTEIKSTLTLKNEADKLTGKVVTKLSDAQTIEATAENVKLEKDELTFTIKPEFDGNSITIKFTGKLSAETIKGNVEIDGSQTYDWEAKRETK